MLSFLSTSYVYILLPIVAYYIYRWLTAKKYRLPPGPKAWPFIGSIPDPYSSPLTYKRLMEDWKTKYGDVVLFKRLGMDFVYVSDYKLGYEAFVNKYPKELAGRPLNGVDRLSVGGDNIFFTRSMDATFVELRKQIMIALRKVAEPEKMFNIAFNAYEFFKTHVEEEKSLVEKGGFYVEPICYWVGHNILSQLFFSKPVEYENPDFQGFIGTINTLMKEVGNLAFFDITPLNALPVPRKRRVVNLSKILSSKVMGIISKRREKGNFKQDPKYFIDHFMQIQESQKENKQCIPNLPFMDDWYISNLALDIYFAGLDAFGIGFTWTIGLLALYPQVQQKIRDELSNMTEEKNEPFNAKWIDNLHYLNAVIYEIMRVHSLSSFTSFHRAMEDVKIGEYDIPKNTIVALNIYGAHHDPKYWKEPHTFNPERFLNENGKLQLPKDGFMPFGAGRRICVAERYTVKESHALFTGRICQDFQLVWTEKNKIKSIEEDEENTFFRHTVPFYVEFKPLN